MTTCRICDTVHPVLLYTSPRPRSLTSDCKIVPGPTKVRFCADCGHLQTDAVLAADDFYADKYNIFSEHEDEDMLYSVQNGRRIYRTEHQMQTLLSKCDIPEGASVLDYGCAKGHLLRKLKERRPDVRIFAFDVSSAYAGFWERFIPGEQCAAFQIPSLWTNRFDVVLSSFMLEHVAEPVGTVAAMLRLLRPGGMFYGIVPNVFENFADLLVADHLNHFSSASLQRLLRMNAISRVSIDDRAHESAFVFSGIKNEEPASPPVMAPPPGALADRVRAIAEFWAGYSSRVAALEKAHSSARRVAIYGAGFYGTLLAATLEAPSKICCFMDRDPYRQGKEVMGHAVLAPETLPKDIDFIYVGLNPRIAKSAITDFPAYGDIKDKFLFP